MVYELVFTSYHRGLKTGSSGFTTVAHTESMPRNYVILCESLSGYQYAYSLSHPLYNQNPVAYSHYSFKSGDRHISILSRVSAFGKDYTGRENKLAHHILLDSDERVSGGPAWVMDQGNLFFDKWDMEPHRLEQGRIQMPAGDKENYEAQSWKKVFGDARPAATLARSALEMPDTPAFIIFQPGMPILTLIEEALCLLPPEKRWQITFNTYFTVKPIDSDCQWRCCLQDSDALAASKRYPGALIIDIPNQMLSRELSEKDELIICARDGSEPPWAAKKFKRMDAATSDPFALPDIKKPHVPDKPSPGRLIQKPKKKDNARWKKILIRTGLLIFALVMIIFLLLLFSHQIPGLNNLRDKTNTSGNKQSSKNMTKQSIPELPPMDPPKIYPEISPIISPKLILPDKNEEIQKTVETSQNEVNDDDQKNINKRTPPKKIRFETHSSDARLPLGENINFLKHLTGYVFDIKGKAAEFVIEREAYGSRCNAEINLPGGKKFGKILGNEVYDDMNNESQCDHLTLTLKGDYSYSEADRIARGNSDYPYAAVYFSEPALLIWISPVVLKPKMIKPNETHSFYIDLAAMNQSYFSEIFSGVSRNQLKGSIYSIKRDYSFPIECSEINNNQLLFHFPDNEGQLDALCSQLDKAHNTLRESINALIEIKKNKNPHDDLSDENLWEKIKRAEAFKPLEKDIKDIKELIEGYEELRKNNNENNDQTDESASSLKTATKELEDRITGKAESLLKKISDERDIIQVKQDEIKTLLNFLDNPGSIFPENIYTFMIYYRDDKDSLSSPILFITQ